MGFRICSCHGVDTFDDPEDVNVSVICAMKNAGGASAVYALLGIVLGASGAGDQTVYG